jgi:dienelactone hydrolase
MRLVPLLIATLSFVLPALALASPPGAAGTCTPASTHAVRSFATELAGVPARIRVPAHVSLPPIVLWHGFGPPASEDALEAMLPLDDVPAVKVYLGLPMFGKRAPKDPGLLARRQKQNLATGVFEPVVMGAARELPRVVAALRGQGCLRSGQGIGLFGFSAGGAAALYALAERDVPVRAAMVLNASTGLSASVAAYERVTGKAFAWTPQTRALAQASDAVARAADIARGTPALLVVQGAHDGVVDANDARALDRALAPYYAGDAAARLHLDVVDGLPHAIDKPGDVARVRALASAWFLRFMQGRKGS